MQARKIIKALINKVRLSARDVPIWVAIQDANREGWNHAGRRIIIQRAILTTPPVRTATIGKTEIRVLTWHRDWINQVWALKSFYHYAEVDYPLYIHDGGLRHENITALQQHFPNAIMVLENDARIKVSSYLLKHGYRQCLAFREQNAAAKKLLDYIILSKADRIISIDSDIVFFRRPEELLDESNVGASVNRYNKDEAYWYSSPLQSLSALLGKPVCTHVNSGLSSIWSSSIHFDQIERWLMELKSDSRWEWVVEQTLHALCSSNFGVELLPDTYKVSTKVGISEDTTCKHYPGYFRPLLYEEGMNFLVNRNFLKVLRARLDP